MIGSGQFSDDARTADYPSTGTDTSPSFVDAGWNSAAFSTINSG